jgi:hypothetical protein
MSAEGSAYTDGKYEANSVIGLYITSRYSSGTIVAKSMSSGKQMLVVFMCFHEWAVAGRHAAHRNIRGPAGGRRL